MAIFRMREQLRLNGIGIFLCIGWGKLNLPFQTYKYQLPFETAMDTLIILIRMLLTFLSSLVFGLERQTSHKPVGFGTFIFVALGASALGIFASLHDISSSISLLSAVVTGIGFLGAGALIRGPDKVFGFTTAASIWLLAIFGLMTGFGEYRISAAIYLFIWLVILFDKYLEKRGIGSYQRKLSIVTNTIINEKDIITRLLIYTKKHKILSAEVKKESNEMHLHYLVEGGRENLNKMVRSLFKEEWIKSAKIE